MAVGEGYQTSGAPDEVQHGNPKDSNDGGDSSLKEEATYQAEATASEDQKEGMKAFIEKRGIYRIRKTLLIESKYLQLAYNERTNFW